MLLLETGPMLAIVLVLLQMPAIWADLQAGLGLLSFVARDHHLFPRSLPRIEVRHVRS